MRGCVEDSNFKSQFGQNVIYIHIYKWKHRDSHIDFVFKLACSLSSFTLLSTLYYKINYLGWIAAAFWKWFCANSSYWSCITQGRVENCCELNSRSKRRGYPFIVSFFCDVNPFHHQAIFSHLVCSVQRYCSINILNACVFLT